VFGRFFCSWICPFGIFNQWVSHLFNKRRPADDYLVNAYRPVYRLKYYYPFGLPISQLLERRTLPQTTCILRRRSHRCNISCPAFCKPVYYTVLVPGPLPAWCAARSIFRDIHTEDTPGRCEVY
jgi:hypothetical protein